jgi:MFS family permease
MRTELTGEVQTLKAQRGDRRYYPWYVLGVLFLVYVFNFIDRNILSILSQDIKATLRVGDAELGFLYGTAFAIFYTLFGIPLGRLADRWYRGRLIALGLAVWSLMTAASGLASSYAQLAFARVGVGIGEASATPAAYSLLADHFPPRRRAIAIAIYSAGLFVGGGLSLPLGGWIENAWSHAYPPGAAPFGLTGWQAAFLGVGLPGLALSLWVLSLREPARGQSEGQSLPAQTPGAFRDFLRELAAILPPFTLWSVARIPGGLRMNVLLLGLAAVFAGSLARVTGDTAQWVGFGVGAYAIASWFQVLAATDRPTFVLILGSRAPVLALLGFGGIGFIVYSLTFWVPPYTMRTFGVAPHVAGLALGVPSGFAAGVGCVAGGYLSDAWKRRDPRGRLFVCASAMLAVAPLTVVMVTTHDVWTVYALFPLQSALVYTYLGSGAAAIQDCVLPRMRGVAGAIYLLSLSILGLALGPYTTGKVAALTGSLRLGILSMLAVIPPTLVLLWLAAQGLGEAEASRVERARAAGEPGVCTRPGCG